MSSEPAKKKPGRPKGSRSLENIARDKALSAIQMRIFKMSMKLVNSQAVAALGTHKVITMEKDEDGVMHVKTIRDEKKMTELLDTGEYGKDYLIVVGAEPDWKAAESLFNRAYGKPSEYVDVSSGGKPVPLLSAALTSSKNVHRDDSSQEDS